MKMAKMKATKEAKTPKDKVKAKIKTKIKAKMAAKKGSC